MYFYLISRLFNFTDTPAENEKQLEGSVMVSWKALNKSACYIFVQTSQHWQAFLQRVMKSHMQKSSNGILRSWSGVDFCRALRVHLRSWSNACRALKMHPLSTSWAASCTRRSQWCLMWRDWLCPFHRCVERASYSWAKRMEERLLFPTSASSSVTRRLSPTYRWGSLTASRAKTSFSCTSNAKMRACLGLYTGPTVLECFVSGCTEPFCHQISSPSLL